MSRGRAVAVIVPAALAASAIGHGTAGAPPTGAAVVAVGEGGASVATGFAVSPGRVVTVAHGLERDTVTVRGADGVARSGRVVRRDDTLDLALLAVPGLRASPHAVGVGTRMLVWRDGGISTVAARIVRPITARVRVAGDSAAWSRPALELAARVEAGDSGAPVLRDGRVAGVVFARSHDRADVAYAVDAAALARFVR
jgi:Trypsin-like peptidase domain